jgi:hypothetical protein
MILDPDEIEAELVRQLRVPEDAGIIVGLRGRKVAEFK